MQDSPFELQQFFYCSRNNIFLWASSFGLNAALQETLLQPTPNAEKSETNSLVAEKKPGILQLSNLCIGYESDT